MLTLDLSVRKRGVFTVHLSRPMLIIPALQFMVGLYFYLSVVFLYLLPGLKPYFFLLSLNNKMQSLDIPVWGSIALFEEAL